MTIGSAFSQNPLMKMWDYRFGGSLDDQLTYFQKTTDGGFVLAGNSTSGISGDKTQPHWGTQGFWDYWIVKLDSQGTKQWDKTFGGTDNDYLYAVVQTTDGGYILGGNSYSPISGDKTQGVWGAGDYWIVKTDALGNMLWDKNYGGVGNDILYDICLTADGGYILTGYSTSGISGDKATANWGSFDYWIIKIDSLGIMQWEQDYGGTWADIATSLKPAVQGGYLLAGYSLSGISGNKTQPTWGLSDFWIIKIDSLGNIQWDKDFGGTDIDYLYSFVQTADEEFVFAGLSYSGISGDKSEPLWGTDPDFWILKTDSLGNKLWDKDYGGTNGEDEFGSIVQTTDGGYLMAGNSYSNISGNKTENNLGMEQSWILKTDSSGNKLWDKTLLTNTSGDDEIGLAVQTNDGCYAMANYTLGGIGGDKSQASQGARDYWIIKFCEALQAGFASPSFICPGSCIDFTNLSFNATSYQWSFPGATPDSSNDVNPTNICYSTPGSYDVELIASNANGSDTLLLPNYITVFPAPLPQSITQSGDTLFAIVGSSLYQWYFNSNIINGASDYFYVAQQSGNYNVVATDINGCEVEAVINNVIAETKLAVGPEVSGQLAIFPNPVNDELRVMSSGFGVTAEISIYNVMGERVLIQESRRKIQEEIIDVSKLGSGLYYIEVKSGEKIFRSKFVKSGRE